MKPYPEIVFLFPSYDRNFEYHLGVNYIIAYLKQKGIYAEQFTSDRPLRLLELIERLLERKPKIIGFTCYDRNYFFIKLLSQYLKAKNKEILIVVGGPTATFSDKVILKNTPEIDICVRGEGEYTVFEIIKQLNTNKNFDNIPGISYRFNGKIYQTPDRPLIGDKNNQEAELDIIPSPYLTGALSPEDMLKTNGRISILTARGCIYKCTYCNFSSMSRHTIRYHSAERVISELKMINDLKGHKKDITVSIFDDTFTLNKERAKRICRLILKENIDLNFVVDTRGDHVDEETLKLLFKGGTRWINFGLESAVPRILYKIKKARLIYDKKDNFRPEKEFIRNIKKSVNLAKKIGFNTSVSIILGLPGETFKDGLKTINFVKKLKVDCYSHNFLLLTAGTELFDTYQKNTNDLSEMRFRRWYERWSHGTKKYSSYYTYPVNKIPDLGNESFHSEIKQINLLNTSRALMGLYEENDKLDNTLDIISIKKIPLEWLINNVSFQSRIIFSNDIDKLLNKENKNISIILSPSIYLLSKLLCIDYQNEDLSIANLSDSYLTKTKNDFLSINFSQLNDFLFNKRKISNLTLIINSEKDLADFERQISSLAQIKKTIGLNKNKYNCFILDGCRWAKICPAINLKRIIIDRNNNILPCFQGMPIGKVGDSLAKIKKRLLKLWEKKKEERNCENCSAASFCSKCIFVDSMGVDRYCHIKRKYPYLADLIKLLDLSARLNYILKTPNYHRR